jgi:hypothetical protein
MKVLLFDTSKTHLIYDIIVTLGGFKFYYN